MGQANANALPQNLAFEPGEYGQQCGNRAARRRGQIKSLGQREEAHAEMRRFLTAASRSETDLPSDPGARRARGRFPGAARLTLVHFIKASLAHLRRWGQPGQQHGLRMPSMSSEHTRSTCCFRVSSFFTEMVQQIHSLRASGVMSSHASCAAGEARSAFLRSAGNVCTVPLESASFATKLFYDVRCQITLSTLGFISSASSRVFLRQILSCCQ